MERLFIIRPWCGAYGTVDSGLYNISTSTCTGIEDWQALYKQLKSNETSKPGLECALMLLKFRHLTGPTPSPFPCLVLFIKLPRPSIQSS